MKIEYLISFNSFQIMKIENWSIAKLKEVSQSWKFHIPATNDK